MLEWQQRSFTVRGRSVTHQYVHFPQVVVVLARDEEDRVLAVRQYRGALDREILELPAGKVEPGEELPAAAVRELEEETGHRAGRVEHRFWFWPAPGYSDEVIHVFVASDLTPTAPNPDEGEELQLVRLSAEECAAAIASGEIRDGKSLLTLLAMGAGLRQP